jgi:hypothetical protein
MTGHRGAAAGELTRHRASSVPSSVTVDLGDSAPGFASQSHPLSMIGEAPEQFDRLGYRSRDPFQRARHAPGRSSDRREQAHSRRRPQCFERRDCSNGIHFEASACLDAQLVPLSWKAPWRDASEVDRFGNVLDFLLSHRPMLTKDSRPATHTSTRFVTGRTLARRQRSALAYRRVGAGRSR